MEVAREDTGRPEEPGHRDTIVRLLAHELERQGVRPRWLNDEVVLAEVNGAVIGYGFGASHAGSRAAVKVAARRDLSHDLLAAAGLPVAPGRAFPPDTGGAKAERFARRCGAVTLQWARRRYAEPIRLDTSAGDSFADAWGRFDDPRRGTVYVEQEFAGQRATFIVVADECLAIDAEPGSPIPHESYTRAAVAAVRALPGADLAAVTIIATDLTCDATPGGYVIDDVDPTPQLEQYESLILGSLQELAKAIVTRHLRSAAPPGSPPAGQRSRRWWPWPRRRRARPATFRRGYNLNAELAAAALRSRGIEPRWLGRNMVTATVNGQCHGYWATSTHATGHLGAIIAKRKDLARELLIQAGVEVAEGAAFARHQREAAAAFAEKLGDVVVKPAEGNKGRGVTVGVQSPVEFDRAWELAARHARRNVLVEKRFAGPELRFLVIGDSCRAVIRRIVPQVVGNGRDSIQQLIDAKNTLRAKHPVLRNRLIQLDAHRVDHIRRQGYGLDDAPPEGLVVTLDLKAGISSGAESEDLTDQVHPSLKTVAARAACAFPGLDVVGVDILVNDFRSAAEPGSYIVCELNHEPGIGSHHFPVYGSGRDVMGEIVAYHIARS